MDQSVTPLGSASFFNQLFGTIAGYSSLDRVSAGTSFIPVDANGKTLKIRGLSAKWMGMRSRSVQKQAYEFCYPVASIVDRLAEYDLTGKLEILRSQGKATFDAKGKRNIATNEWATRMRARLAQPNAMQSWEQFRGQQVMYKKVFGFCPVLPIIPVGFETQPWMCSAIINLPPWLFTATPTRNSIISAVDKSDVVAKYSVSILGKTVDLKPDDVFILEDSFMQDEATDFLLPLSRLVGLDMAISNICAAMEADNVLLRKKGPLGFISHDAATKDQVSYTPMLSGQKKQLQADLTKYGLSWDQYQYVISRVAAKWNPMSFNVAELGTKETIIACEKAICHRFAFPYVIYEESERAYVGGDNAVATCYQTNIIPNGDKDINKYNKFFKALDNDCFLDYNFDDVAALQEDKKAAADSRKVLNDALKIEYDSDLITLNQWREKMGWDTVPGGDALKSSVENTSQPLAVKLGVGGTTALTSILANAALTPESKTQALVLLFGMLEADAKKLVGEPEQPEPDFTKVPDLALNGLNDN